MSRRCFLLQLLFAVRFTQRIRRSRQRSSFGVALALAAFVSVQTFFRLASPEFREHEVLLLVPFRQRCCWYCCCCCCRCFYCVVLFQHLFSLAVQVVLELVQVKFDGGGGHDDKRSTTRVLFLFLCGGRKFTHLSGFESSSSSSTPFGCHHYLSFQIPILKANFDRVFLRRKKRSLSLSLSLSLRVEKDLPLSECNKKLPTRKPSGDALFFCLGGGPARARAHVFCLTRREQKRKRGKEKKTDPFSHRV